MNWEKIGKTVTEEGTTITYRSQDPMVTVESRKKKIPRAYGSGKGGAWEHTTFVVCVSRVPVHECSTLADAKAYAEQMMGMV